MRLRNPRTFWFLPAIISLTSPGCTCTMKLLTTTTFFSLVAAGASGSTTADPDQQQQFPDDDETLILGTQTTITTSSTFLRRGLMKVEEASSETEVGGDPEPSTGTRKYSRSTKKPLFKPIDPSNVLQYHERLEQQQKQQDKLELRGAGAGATSSAKSLLQNKRTKVKDENTSASRTDESGTRNQDQLVQIERKTKVTSLLHSGKNPLSKLLSNKKKKVDETTSVLLELQRPPVTQQQLQGRTRSAIVVPKNQRNGARNTVVTTTSRAGGEPARLSHLQKQRRSAISTRTSTQELQHRKKISNHAEHQQGSSAPPTTVKEALESVEFFLAPLRDKLEQEIFKSCTKPYIEEIKRVYQHAVTPIESLAIKKTEENPIDPDARLELEQNLEELETRRISYLSPLYDVESCAQNLQTDPNCHQKKKISDEFLKSSTADVSVDLLSGNTVSTQNPGSWPENTIIDFGRAGRTTDDNLELKRPGIKSVQQVFYDLGTTEAAAGLKNLPNFFDPENIDDESLKVITSSTTVSIETPLEEDYGKYTTYEDFYDECVKSKVAETFVSLGNTKDAEKSELFLENLKQNLGFLTFGMEKDGSVVQWPNVGQVTDGVNTVGAAQPDASAVEKITPEQAVQNLIVGGDLTSDDSRDSSWYLNTVVRGQKRNVVIAVDISMSMWNSETVTKTGADGKEYQEYIPNTQRWENARSAVDKALDGLDGAKGDRFNVMVWSTDVFFSSFELVRATKENILKAKIWLKEQAGAAMLEGSGTHPEWALASALALGTKGIVPKPLRDVYFNPEHSTVVKDGINGTAVDQLWGSMITELDQQGDWAAIPISWVNSSPRKVPWGESKTTVEERLNRISEEFLKKESRERFAGNADLENAECVLWSDFCETTVLFITDADNYKSQMCLENKDEQGNCPSGKVTVSPESFRGEDGSSAGQMLQDFGKLFKKDWGVLLQAFVMIDEDTYDMAQDGSGAYPKAWEPTLDMAKQHGTGEITPLFLGQPQQITREISRYWNSKSLQDDYSSWNQVIWHKFSDKKFLWDGDYNKTGVGLDGDSTSSTPTSTTNDFRGIDRLVACMALMPSHANLGAEGDEASGHLEYLKSFEVTDSTYFSFLKSRIGVLCIDANVVLGAFHSFRSFVDLRCNTKLTGILGEEIQKKNNANRVGEESCPLLKHREERCAALEPGNGLYHHYFMQKYTQAGDDVSNPTGAPWIANALEKEDRPVLFPQYDLTNGLDSDFWNNDNGNGPDLTAIGGDEDLFGGPCPVIPVNKFAAPEATAAPDDTEKESTPVTEKPEGEADNAEEEAGEEQFPFWMLALAVLLLLLVAATVAYCLMKSPEPEAATAEEVAQQIAIEEPQGREQVSRKAGVDSGHTMLGIALVQPIHKTPGAPVEHADVVAGRQAVAKKTKKKEKKKKPSVVEETITTTGEVEEPDLGEAEDATVDQVAGLRKAKAKGMKTKPKAKPKPKATTKKQAQKRILEENPEVERIARMIVDHFCPHLDMKYARKLAAAVLDPPEEEDVKKKQEKKKAKKGAAAAAGAANKKPPPAHILPVPKDEKDKKALMEGKENGWPDYHKKEFNVPRLRELLGLSPQQIEAFQQFHAMKMQEHHREVAGAPEVDLKARRNQPAETMDLNLAAGVIDKVEHGLEKKRAKAKAKALAKDKKKLKAEKAKKKKDHDGSDVEEAFVTIGAAAAKKSAKRKEEKKKQQKAIKAAKLGKKHKKAEMTKEMFKLRQVRKQKKENQKLVEVRVLTQVQQEKPEKNETYKMLVEEGFSKKAALSLSKRLSDTDNADLDKKLKLKLDPVDMKALDNMGGFETVAQFQGYLAAKKKAKEKKLEKKKEDKRLEEKLRAQGKDEFTIKKIKQEVKKKEKEKELKKEQVAAEKVDEEKYIAVLEKSGFKHSEAKKLAKQLKEPTPAADKIGHEHEEKIDISEQVEKALRGSGKADQDLIKKVKEKVKKKEKEKEKELLKEVVEEFHDDQKCEKMFLEAGFSKHDAHKAAKQMKEASSHIPGVEGKDHGAKLDLSDQFEEVLKATKDLDAGFVAKVKKEIKKHVEEKEQKLRKEIVADFKNEEKCETLLVEAGFSKHDAYKQAKHVKEEVSSHLNTASGAAAGASKAFEKPDLSEKILTTDQDVGHMTTWQKKIKKEDAVDGKSMKMLENLMKLDVETVDDDITPDLGKAEKASVDKGFSLQQVRNFVEKQVKEKEKEEKKLTTLACDMGMAESALLTAGFTKQAARSIAKKVGDGDTEANAQLFTEHEVSADDKEILEKLGLSAETETASVGQVRAFIAQKVERKEKKQKDRDTFIASANTGNAPLTEILTKDEEILDAAEAETALVMSGFSPAVAKKMAHITAKQDEAIKNQKEDIAELAGKDDVFLAGGEAVDVKLMCNEIQETFINMDDEDKELDDDDREEFGLATEKDFRLMEAFGLDDEADKAETAVAMLGFVKKAVAAKKHKVDLDLSEATVDQKTSLGQQEISTGLQDKGITKPIADELAKIMDEATAAHKEQAGGPGGDDDDDDLFAAPASMPDMSEKLDEILEKNKGKLQAKEEEELMDIKANFDFAVISDPDDPEFGLEMLVAIEDFINDLKKELHAKQAKERASEIQKNQKAIEKDFEEEEEKIMKAVEADMENKRGSVLQGGGFQQKKPKPKPGFFAMLCPCICGGGGAADEDEDDSAEGLLAGTSGGVAISMSESSSDDDDDDDETTTEAETTGAEATTGAEESDESSSSEGSTEGEETEVEQHPGG